jgi:hypothetical protein
MAKVRKVKDVAKDIRFPSGDFDKAEEEINQNLERENLKEMRLFLRE